MTQPIRPEHSVTVVIPIARLGENGEPLVVRRRGRPRRVAKAPCVSQITYELAIGDAAERMIERDDLVRAEPGGDQAAVTEKVMKEIAKESAALAFERQKATREGRPEAERISSRRVAALLRVGELAVLREQLLREAAEPRVEHVEKAVGLAMEVVEESVREVAPAEQAEAFMATLRRKMSAADFPSCCASRASPACDGVGGAS